jgi:hypothetical protein
VKSTVTISQDLSVIQTQNLLLNNWKSLLIRVGILPFYYSRIQNGVGVRNLLQRTAFNAHFHSGKFSAERNFCKM